jgi:hypothetical protein
LPFSLKSLPHSMEQLRIRGRHTLLSNLFITEISNKRCCCLHGKLF